MLIGLFMGVFLVAALAYVVGIGEAIAQREGVQDAADAAAFSAAVLHARGMNVIALVNMVMAALLAILIALKLVEALCAIAIALIALGAFFLEPALVAQIPEVEGLREQVRAAHDALEPDIESALEALHVLARGIRVVVPAAAQLRTIELISAQYRHRAVLGVVLPTQAALPTEDAPFAQLCDHASGYVGGLVGLALDRVVPRAVARDVADATADLARDASDWYCGDAGGDPARTHVRRIVQHPTLPARAACIAYDANRPGYDPVEHQRLCRRAQEDESASRPDSRTGACVDRCAADGPYAQRVELARRECAPDEASRFTSFSWVERAVEREYVFRHGAWRVARERVVAGSTRRRRSTLPPCGDVHAAIGKDWNAQVHATGSDRIQPVCSSEDAPERRGAEGETFGPVRGLEVLHILGCSEDAVLQRDVARDPKSLRDDAEHSRSPQALVSGAELGEAPFQLRAYVLGASSRANVERILDVASWGTLARSAEFGAEHARLAALLDTSRSAFAQAEYYYAVRDGGAAERASYLWNMRWQARLRRFRLPEAPASSGAGASQSADFGVQPVALDLLEACARAHVLVGAGLGEGCPSDAREANDLLIH
jgi:hypothetical protein